MGFTSRPWASSECSHASISFCTIASLLILFLGKDKMQQVFMNMDIPKPMRKLVPRSHFEARVDHLTEEVKSNFYSNLENEKNAEITERMVTEITAQIEQCLTKMAQVVEIPLG